MSSVPRIRLNEAEYALIKSLRANNYHINADRNVLVIGDLHEPFSLNGYLEFNVRLRDKYNVSQVIFAGDIIDNHFSSYHETDADGYGAGDELELAIKKLELWYKEFPSAIVTIGNHDRMVMRKALTGGISARWIKPYEDVLGVPNWKFVESITLDDVLYIHGDGGGKAIARARKNMQSTVCGHWHTESYVQYIVGARFKVFGMQVGCGIDKDAYSMAYAKHFGKPAISSGIVLDSGRLPIIEMMNL